ncbi:Sulfotransferase [Heracleum sosnowskyi]|uniref:Sulfotransferase n=1 Tax=Heracleum sosnowskyi TaxID=360622 RepID=A0AAD8H8R6_9APIA|nr:Sulfotransferase [Heracleum sosnowskyi]
MEQKSTDALEVISPNPNHQKNIVAFSQEFLSSLPEEKGLVEDFAYQYQGSWYTPILLQGVIDCQLHFQPRENDVFLVTAPKSGTTWLKAILYALINRQIHHPQDAHHPLLNKTPHQLVPFFELTKSSEYDSFFSDSSRRIFACHIPIASLPKSITEDDGSTNIKIVFLCRDIKDNFASLYHFSNNTNLGSTFLSLEETFDLYCKGVTAGGPIWDQILGYWKESLESPNKVLFMRYEELKSEPHVQLKRLAQFLGKPFSTEEEISDMIEQIISLCSFGNMSKLQVNNTGHLVPGLGNSSFFSEW